jgi:hypothetical protein
MGENFTLTANFIEEYTKWRCVSEKPGYCSCCGALQDGNQPHDPECIWVDDEKQERLDLETQ